MLTHKNGYAKMATAGNRKLLKTPERKIYRTVYYNIAKDVVIPVIVIPVIAAPVRCRTRL
jgi:hypothetical protein